MDKIEARDQSLYHHPFTFDKVFPKTTTNKDIYKNACQQIILNSLEGIDTTIFVYGQTGSGKTHTILGPPKTF